MRKCEAAINMMILMIYDSFLRSTLIEKIIQNIHNLFQDGDLRPAKID